MRKYQEIFPIDRIEAENIIKQGSPESIALTLVRLAYFEPDWVWVQNTCIDLASHHDKWVRRSCVTCFGHLSRIHDQIDKKKVMPVVNRLLQDPEVKGEAEDTIEDFKIFIK